MLFDPSTVEFVRDLAPVWLVVLLAVLSFLGSTIYQVPMLAAWYVIEARDRVATWLGIVAGGYAFRSVLKNLNDVSRPPVDSPMDPAAFPALVRPVYEHPAEIATTSFPSGHAIAATVLWGLLVVDTDFATRRKRLALAVLVVVIVTVSRVVLAAHYVEDVVAGVAFGLVFLGAALLVREWSTQPVVAVFSLAGAVSVVAVSIAASTTGSTILGVSVGVLFVIACQRFVRARSSVVRREAGVAAVALLLGTAIVVVLSDAILHTLVGSFVAGAVGYWAPRQSIVRSLVPDAISRTESTGRR